MRNLVIGFAALAVWCAPQSVDGQTRSASPRLPERLFGTAHVKSETMTRAGRIGACNLHFKLIAKDFAYRNGAPVGISGVLGLLRNTSTFSSGFTMLALDDYDAAADSWTTMLPATAHLMGQGNLSTADSFFASGPSSDGKYLMSSYEPFPFLEIITGALESRSKELTVLVAREAGGIDIAATLQLDVVSIDREGNRSRSQREIASFTSCIRSGL
jgi:hypothetical protein